MESLGAERERIAQILVLPDAYERVLELLARTYRLGWDSHAKYMSGSLEMREAANPYERRPT